MDWDDFDVSDYTEGLGKTLSRRFNRAAASRSQRTAPAAPAAPIVPNQAEIKHLAEKVARLDRDVEKINKFGDAIEGRMGASISASGFGRTGTKFQSAVRQATKDIMESWSQLYLYIIVLLLLFIVHQVTPTPRHTP